jgi:hypothetical protein
VNEDFCVFREIIEHRVADRNGVGSMAKTTLPGSVSLHRNVSIAYIVSNRGENGFNTSSTMARIALSEWSFRTPLLRRKIAEHAILLPIVSSHDRLDAFDVAALQNS